MSTEMESMITDARDPETSYKRLLKLFEHPEKDVRRAIIDNPHVCPIYANDLLDTSLLQDLAEEFPEEVAAHPFFVLHALIEPNDEFESVVILVIQGTKNAGLIEQLLRTWGPSWWSVRQAVAQNPSTPVDVLRTLGNQKTESDVNVRRVVAKNPSTPVDVLRTLGNEQTESKWRVRQGVAMNPNTPVDIIRTLGNEQTESNANVRWTVASNPRTPVDLLRSLGNEKTESHHVVREAAQKALADRGLT